MFQLNNNLKPESKVIEVEVKNGIKEKVCVTEFKSIDHIMKYINNTPLNDTFRWSNELPSQGTSSSYATFTGTQNYEEAQELLRTGYSEGTEKLVSQLKVQSNTENKMVSKIVLDVVGFQPCVTNYLMGIPQNMMNSKMVPKKQKVITINKCIDYNAGVSAKEILEYSARTLRIIKELESKGYAVNLNIVDGYSSFEGRDKSREIIKVRIKNSNERLSIGKLSFPLLHPSMLRRIMFRYVEVSDTTPCRTKSRGNIGCCVEDGYYLKLLGEEKEIFLNRYVTEEQMNNITEIKFGELQ